MAQQGNAVSLLVQDANGQKQILKVMQTSSSGKPLTHAGVKAIVKEVTGHDATRVLGKNVNASHKIQSLAVDSQGSQIHKINYTSTIPNKTIKLSPSQLSTLKVVQGPSTNLMNKLSVATPTVSSSTSGNKRTPTTSSGSTVQTKRRKTDKVGKGLRHFSMKVCEKVKEKGVTTYNEVADELVQEEIEGQPIDPMNYDQKNIRRRVYDALNVLMAMNIISKEKKEIRWIGLPSNSIQQCNSLEQENQQRRERIEAKQQQLRELLLQQVSFKSLVSRNKEAEENGIIPTPNSAIQLPFIIVNTHKKTQINCSISNDKSEYYFKFEDKFEIHDDVEVLKRMGLLLGLDKGKCELEDIERAKSMVPKAFRKYIEMYGKGQEDIFADEYDVQYSYGDSDILVPKLEYCAEEDLDISDSDGD